MPRWLVVRIDNHPRGPRLYVAGCRVHHWHWGAALMLVGARLVWLDREDVVAALRRQDAQ